MCLSEGPRFSGTTRIPEDPCGAMGRLPLKGRTHELQRAMSEPQRPGEPGTDSYLVSRPLADPTLGKVASHNYVVTHARYPGDPKAKVFSYGHAGKSGKLDRVDLLTGTPKVGAGSRNTYVNDRKHWLSMKAQPQPGNLSKINAPCGVVESYARGLRADQDYRMVPLSNGTANSNTAAQAVADRSAGKPVPTPGKGRLSPGAGVSDKIRFRNQENLEKLRTRGRGEPPSRDQLVSALRRRADRNALSVQPKAGKSGKAKGGRG